jgi:HEAT repeat protein
MAKARGVDAKLARLRALGTEPVTPAVLRELRDAIGDKSNLVVAAAAEIVGERTLTDLAPDLVTAFRRFLVDPVETDKLCRAKLAIVEALHRIEFDAEDVFRIGLRHVQPEPRWGGSDDTAAPLRGIAAFALVRLGPRDLMILLADLLADPEKVARSAAAKALGSSGALAAIPLLRYKARTGDPEPEVTVECLSGLMTADPEGSLSLVAEFLESETEEVAEGAALALAESRRPAALDALMAQRPRVRSESLQSVLLLAVAITRLPAALDFLLGVLAKEDEAAASAALSALAIHRQNPAVRERIAAVLTTRNDPGLSKQFAREFRTRE